MSEISRLEGRVAVQVPQVAAVRLGLKGRDVETVSREICDGSAAFHFVFIHADRGGRELERTLDQRSLSYCRQAHEICQWPADRCIVMAPKHETEAWVLADPDAVTRALGYAGPPTDLNLPRNAASAENLTDPKAVLSQAVQSATGRNRGSRTSQVFAAIAQSQSIESLRQASSFRDFEAQLRSGLATVGVLGG
jgi:hypothetical protein